MIHNAEDDDLDQLAAMAAPAKATIERYVEVPKEVSFSYGLDGVNRAALRGRIVSPPLLC